MKIWEKINDFLFRKQNKMLSSKFIIDAVPREHKVSELEAIRAQTRIEERSKTGISENDINTILKYIVNNTRSSLKEELQTLSLDTEDMMGLCGFAQAIAAYQLKELGVDINIGNIGGLDFSDARHAYVVANFPVNINGELQTKKYLLDTTYRQFFQTKYANYEQYFMGNDAPSAGYFVCKTNKGQEFANKLIEDGYIELTEENAKIYGDGFYLTCKGKSEYKNGKPPKGKISTPIKGEQYLQDITKQNGELDYSKEELEYIGALHKTPKDKMNYIENQPEEENEKTIESKEQEIEDKGMEI